MHHVAQLQTQRLAHQQRAFAKTPPALAPAGPTRPVDGKYGGSRKLDAYDSRPGTGHACPGGILRRNVSKLPFSIAQQQTDGDRAGSWQRAKFWAKRPSKVEKAEKVPVSRTSERLRPLCWTHSMQNQDHPPTRPTTIPAIPYLPHHGTIPCRRKITMSPLGRATGTWENNRAGTGAGWLRGKYCLETQWTDIGAEPSLFVVPREVHTSSVCADRCCTCLVLLDTFLWG